MALLRVVNAGPLILLGKIRRLELLDVGGREFVIPSSVLKEVQDRSRPGLLSGWESSLPIPVALDVLVPPEVVRCALDPGESMVLSVALVLEADGEDVEVVLDEKLGRRAARSLGLRLWGRPGC